MTKITPLYSLLFRMQILVGVHKVSLNMGRIFEGFVKMFYRSVLDKYMTQKVYERVVKEDTYVPDKCKTKEMHKRADIKKI